MPDYPDYGAAVDAGQIWLFDTKSATGMRLKIRRGPFWIKIWIPIEEGRYLFGGEVGPDGHGSFPRFPGYTPLEPGSYEHYYNPPSRDRPA